MSSFLPLLAQIAIPFLVSILLAVAFLARLAWKRVPPPGQPAVSAGETPCAS